MSKRGNSEGGIYQRTSDDRWVGAVHLGWADGKRQRKVIYGRTRTEVAEKMKRLLSDQQQQMPLQSNERLTVGTFLTSWLEDTAKPSVRASTFESYSSHIAKHIIPNVGTVQLTKLTPQHVEKMMATIMKNKLSARTAAHARAILRGALADAVKWGMVARNAAALADPPRVVAPEIVTLTPDEARKFVEGIRSHPEHALYLVTLACGLRLGEVTGLAWQDVDLDAGTVRVRQTLGRGSGEFRIGEPKSRTSRRQLALPEAVVEALKARKTAQKTDKLKAGDVWRNDWDLVFTTAIGEPLNPSSLTRRFRLLLASLKLPQMRFHDLRHSCASLLIAEGVHPRLIMETLGHSQISVTMNLYGHVAPVVQREVADRMGGILAARETA